MCVPPGVRSVHRIVYDCAPVMQSVFWRDTTKGRAFLRTRTAPIGNRCAAYQAAPRGRRSSTEVTGLFAESLHWGGRMHPGCGDLLDLGHGERNNSLSVAAIRLFARYDSLRLRTYQERESY